MYNVIIYARVSTLIQAEQGYSIDCTTRKIVGKKLKN